MDKEKKRDFRDAPITSEEYINGCLEEASEDSATSLALILASVKRIFRQRGKKK